MPAVRRASAPLRMERRRLEDAVRHYVEQCLTRRTAPRVAELADLVGVSRRRVTHVFRRAFGCSARELMIRFQLIEAERLLRETTRRTSDIASAAGFGTQSTFFRVFKNERGMTPEQYRKGFLE